MIKKWQIAYRLQAVAAWLGIAFFRVLPADAASWLGGWLARHIGPFTGAHKTAVHNLALAMPEKTPAERAKIIKGMWDNIGRTIAEYPHLEKLIDDERLVEVVDPEGQARRFHDDNIGGLLIGMHFGNWELSTVPGYRAGLRQHPFYRAPNNPFVDNLLVGLRKKLNEQSYIPKGAAGARQAVMLLKQGAHVGMLVDQKQDEGIALPFFGREAMTTTAPAAFARRLGVPIAAAKVERLGGMKFRITVAGIEVTKTADREADILETTKRINCLMENWVRERPEQWFWVHRRWPKS